MFNYCLLAYEVLRMDAAVFCEISISAGHPVRCKDPEDHSLNLYCRKSFQTSQINFLRSSET